MRKYIKDLTDNLISKNHYDMVAEMLIKAGKFSEMFVGHVKLDLEACDVAKMRPETLGKIMASFEVGDVMTSREELFESLYFGGDCESLLRQSVSLALAYVIRDRLDSISGSSVPWKRKK
jgi:hypothetical protein